MKTALAIAALLLASLALAHGEASKREGVPAVVATVVKLSAAKAAP